MLIKKIADQIVPGIGGDIYDDEERVIGTYYGKPLYRKVFKIGDVTGSRTIYLPYYIEELETLIKIGGVYRINSASGSYSCIPSAVSTNDSDFSVTAGFSANKQLHIWIGAQRGAIYDAIIVAEYTKTTDTAIGDIGTNYNFGIVSNNYEEYSTEEKRIGTWIDGKPIYRKTIINTTNSASYNFAHNIENIDNIINIYGTVKSLSYGNTLPFGFNDGNVNIVSIHANASNIGIQISEQGYASGEKRVIIEYTKTTDTIS